MIHILKISLGAVSAFRYDQEMSNLESKRIFLIGSPNPDLKKTLEDWVKSHLQAATIFTADDGLEMLFKMQNVPPDVVILDYHITKISAVDLTEKILLRKERGAVVILSPHPDKEHFIDEVVTGQVQFLSGTVSSTVFGNHLNRAMNWLSYLEEAIYHLRFLSPQEHLLREGEKGDFVYLVKSGQLKAYRHESDNEVILGFVNPGEFVGEMAYINGEPRSANVVCMTDCELIEIRSDSLDSVLFSKPAWSKALMRTLSRRLKLSNEAKS